MIAKARNKWGRLVTYEVKVCSECNKKAKYVGKTNGDGYWGDSVTLIYYCEPCENNTYYEAPLWKHRA